MSEFTSTSERLSDLVEREHAEEIAEKHIPNKFVWERNGTGELTKPPKWMVNAMIEFAKTQASRGEQGPGE